MADQALALTGIRGVLLDIDGVVLSDGQALPGAVTAIEQLRASDLSMCFCTNTTTRSRAELMAVLEQAGVEAHADELITAPLAAGRYLAGHDAVPVHPVVAPGVLEDLGDIAVDRHQPRSILIGDIGTDWDHALIDRLFQQLMGGATLLALHRSRSQQYGGALHVDIGCYVAGLEYASGQTATILGKPAPAFFLSALSVLGLNAEEVAMVGDDIDSDIGGAQACGCTGILCRTGKYRPEVAQRSPVRPHHQIADIGELPQLLGLNGRS